MIQNHPHLRQSLQTTGELQLLGHTKTHQNLCHMHTCFPGIPEIFLALRTFLQLNFSLATSISSHSAGGWGMNRRRHCFPNTQIQHNSTKRRAEKVCKTQRGKVVIGLNNSRAELVQREQNSKEGYSSWEMMGEKRNLPSTKNASSTLILWFYCFG